MTYLKDSILLLLHIWLKQFDIELNAYSITNFSCLCRCIVDELCCIRRSSDMLTNAATLQRKIQPIVTR